MCTASSRCTDPAARVPVHRGDSEPAGQNATAEGEAGALDVTGRASAAPGLRSASRDDRAETETRVHEHLVVIDSNAACRQSLPDCALLTLCDPFELVHCLC